MHSTPKDIENTVSVAENFRPTVDLDEARRVLDRLFEPGDTVERALRPKGAPGSIHRATHRCPSNRR